MHFLDLGDAILCTIVVVVICFVFLFSILKSGSDDDDFTLGNMQYIPKKVKPELLCAHIKECICGGCEGNGFPCCLNKNFKCKNWKNCGKQECKDFKPIKKK